jgi:hypothetical protein
MLPLPCTSFNSFAVNANHPIVKQLIIDSLVHWVEEYHVDGFRFDLASCLCRDGKGHAMAAPPLIREIAKHPVLSKVHLIAEPWDLGMYQVGRSPRGVQDNFTTLCDAVQCSFASLVAASSRPQPLHHLADGAASDMYVLAGISLTGWCCVVTAAKGLTTLGAARGQACGVMQV